MVICQECKTGVDRVMAKAKRCLQCNWKKAQADLKAYRKARPVAMKAYSKLHTSIQRGDIAKLDGSTLCVDCGESARHYDHRDYMRPLDVEPVCASCNIRRGSAVNAA